MKHFSKLLSLLLMLALLMGLSVPVSFTAQAADAEIYALKTDGEANLMGTDNKNPVFSWKMQSSITGQKQTAYRIVVTKRDDDTTVWDSGKVESGLSAGVAYAGEALEAATAYAWKVTVWDKDGKEVTSEPCYFETALFGDGTIDGAQWIKYSAAGEGYDGDMSEYTISYDMEIVRDAAGFVFGATDSSHFYMWQINIKMENGVEGIWLRPHTWNGYGALWNPENLSDYKGYRIDDKVEIKAGQIYPVEIKVTNGRIDTTIDGVLVNSLNTGTMVDVGDLGFRHAKNDASGIVETACYDNITVKDKTGKVVFSEDFADAANYKFAGGTVQNGRLLVEAKSNETIIMQADDALHYIVEADMTLTGSAAGIIFSATDTNNMFMWQFNTANYPGKLYLRPHIWTGGNVTSSDIDLSSHFSVNDVQNKTVRVKLEVTAGNVDTYIGDVKVNSYKTAGLIDGKIGFRVINDGTSREGGIFDNVKVTSYKAAGNEERAYDFTSAINPFTGGVIRDGQLVLQDSSYIILEDVDTGMPVFRKTFRSEKEVASARLYSTALGVYEVYINGQRVANTENGEKVYDEMKPGWTDYNKRVLYHTYDVTDLIQQGGNAVVGMLGTGWWTGRISYGTYGNKDMAFLCKVVIRYTDGTEQVIGTDTSWKATLDGPVRDADIWDGETYDANLEADFSAYDYDDSAWKSTKLSNDFSGVITAYTGANVRVRPELEQKVKDAYIYEGTTATGTDYGQIKKVVEYDALADGTYTIEAGQTLLIDVGQNMVGWPKFTVKGEKDAMVSVRFGEMLNDTGARSRGNDGPAGSIYAANYRSAKSALHYILRGDVAGETYHPNFTFYGYRYMEFTATDTVTITDLQSQVVGSVTEETGIIETSDESVNQLISNILWGQRGNYLSVPTDCPQRDERLGWTGDTQVFVGAASYNADVQSFYLKWAQDIMDSQSADGPYPDVVPRSNVVGAGNGAWGDAGIIVPYTLYKMYGNTQIMQNNYASMTRYMDWLATRPNYDGPNTTYGDWLAYEGTDSRYVSVAYYAYDAMLMSEMAAVLGKTADAQKYATLFENIKAEFNRRYVSADGSMKITTQTAYLLALRFDLLPDEASKTLATQKLVEKIRNNGNKLSTGFVGTGIIAQTLSQVGQSNMAYTLLLQRDNPSWLYSVDQGATTVWERWNSYTLATGFGDVSMNSFNHYSFGAVAEWMYESMAGIMANEADPGFKHFKLAPQIDTRTDAEIPANQKKMTYVSASYDSAYGTIHSQWDTAGEDILTYKATVPANSTATLTLPVLNGTYVTVNGKTYALTSGDAEAKAIRSLDVEGVSYTAQDAETVTLELESGDYKFRVTDTIPEPEPEPEILMGDVDKSGMVDVADIMKLKALIMADKWSDEELTIGDLDASDRLDVGDIMAVKNIIMSK